MKDIKDTLMAIGLIAGFIIFGIGLIIYSFKPETNSHITFEVVGIQNSTNATALVELHYECIKFCAGRFQSTDNTNINKCYEQCSNLGKETCGEVK